MTRLIDRIAWEIWVRLPWEWQYAYAYRIRHRIWRRLSTRVNAALNLRRFVP